MTATTWLLLAFGWLIVSLLLAACWALGRRRPIDDLEDTDDA